MNVDDTVRRVAPAQTEEWAGSADGRAVLGDVLSRPRPASTRGRRRVTRMIAVAAAAGVLGTAGTAAAIGFGSEPPDDYKNTTGSVACGDRLNKESDLAVFRPDRGIDAIEACRQVWPEVYGKPAPKNLVACVYVMNDYSGGGLTVMPAGKFATAREACASAKMYAAPQKVIDNPRG